MIKEERELNIMSWLKTNQVIRIADLSRKLGVSENTVRRDLHRLEKTGILRHVYGGAVLNEKEFRGLNDLEWHEREKRFIKEKEAIGRAAAAMISDSEAIMLDAGTTTMQIARFIDKLRTQ